MLWYMLDNVTWCSDSRIRVVAFFVVSKNRLPLQKEMSDVYLET